MSLLRSRFMLGVSGVLGVALLAAATAIAHDPHPSLAPLSFLVGTWVHEDGGTAWEETWSAPTGDSMIGMTKWLEGAGTRMYEMQAIEANGEGKPVLLIRHFGRGLDPWGGELDGPSAFTLSDFDVQRDDGGAFTSGRIVFGRTDPRSNLPQRISYVFPDADSFTVTVEHGNNDDPNAWMADVNLTFNRLRPR